ncbi:MAG: hypothetical protein EPN97_00605 [Alphaproteobacteria bacterium]|nr:MAG: hypothetical protein EPN97_00605 [Alphaproteobacteria bacterium]
MAKAFTAFQAASRQIKDFDMMGGFPLDLAKKISRQLPFDAALELLKKLPALLKADGREARRRGRAFETGNFGDNYDPATFDAVWTRREKHKEACSKPTSRDRKFAGQLPKGLRKEFYEVVKGEKEYEYNSGAHTVSFNRNLRRLDELLDSPGGRYVWEIHNNIAYSKRMEMGG